MQDDHEWILALFLNFEWAKAQVGLAKVLKTALKRSIYSRVPPTRLPVLAKSIKVVLKTMGVPISTKNTCHVQFIVVNITVC